MGRMYSPDSSHSSLALPIMGPAGCATQPKTAPPLPTPSITGGQSADAAADADRQQKDFERWVMNFRTSARAAGIDEATLQRRVRRRPLPAARRRIGSRAARVHPHGLGLPRQRRVAATRRAGPGQAAAGSRRSRRRGCALRRAARHLVAIWGMESNYGSNFGEHPDHRRAGDARLRGPTRGLGARPVARGVEDPARTATSTARR